MPLQNIGARGGPRQSVLSHPTRGHVHALVPLQVAEGTARKGAAVTFVRFLPGVDAQVALQVHQLGRGVSAQGAVVRLLPVVGLHVTLHVVGVTRGEAAEVTRVQLGQLVLGRQSFVTHLVVVIELRVGARAHPADASEGGAEVRGFGFPGGFAAPKAVGAHEVYARAQGFVAELTAAPAGQVGGEAGLRLGPSALVLPPVVRGAARVVCFTFHAELAVGRALLITQRIHRETDLSSYLCAGETNRGGNDSRHCTRLQPRHSL